MVFVIDVVFLCCRIDIDHSARHLAQKYYGIKDPDYYEFEGELNEYSWNRVDYTCILFCSFKPTLGECESWRKN